MKITSSFILSILTSLILLSGCSKDVDEYNKPAIYWYSQLVSAIANHDLDKADAFYSSLQGEHIGSPLLPEATLILAIAHMHYKEYLLSEHFSNEYVKRYANINEREFAEFMKIKAKYMALPNPRRDQVLMQEAIRDGEVFKRTYPKSMYYSIVDTMLTNLRMAEAALNESIANLYDRLDKPRSAAYYRSIRPQTWINWEAIDRAKTAWYREWFEGDGTESWYAFMIPDTQSVVSRNTLQEEYVVPPKEGKVIENTENFRTTLRKQNKELEQAKKMRDSGILSDAEYQNLRKETFGEDAHSYYQDVQISSGKTTKYISSMQKSQLRKAKALRNEGVLSDEEFKDLENEILNN
ncbi:MAG: outer membrane protein assembly factor BamD [Sulfurimonas sp.]|jgi:outer membrane protein assembly factor BamD|uniref:outer membrane protein assembly factor BamD n=1 Tax=Sulfurimonas sp. TaxID=2022749 RepID=UPI0039E2E99F